MTTVIRFGRLQVALALALASTLLNQLNPDIRPVMSYQLHNEEVPAPPDLAAVVQGNCTNLQAQRLAPLVAFVEAGQTDGLLPLITSLQQSDDQVLARFARTFYSEFIQGHQSLEVVA